MIIDEQLSPVLQCHCVRARVGIRHFGQPHLAPGLAAVLGPDVEHAPLPRAPDDLQLVLFVKQNARLDRTNGFAVVHRSAGGPGLAAIRGAHQVDAPSILNPRIDVDTGYPVDNLYVYHFYLDTQYDVDPQHPELILEPYRIPLPMESTFDLVYAITPTNDYPFNAAATGSSIDALVDTSIAVDDAIYYAVSQESLVLRFGVHLEHLWTRSRTTIGSPTYLTYTADVPAVYTAPPWTLVTQQVTCC